VPDYNAGQCLSCLVLAALVVDQGAGREVVIRCGPYSWDTPAMWCAMNRCGLVGVLWSVIVVGLAGGAEPFRYPEKRHGRGELKYINGLPVLRVAGKPEEIGDQVGALAVKPGAGAVGAFKNYVKQQGLELVWPLLVRLGRQQFDKFPAEYRAELEAMARSSGIDRDVLIAVNTIGDLRNLAGCSGLIVEPARSATGGPLLGRNWDFLPLEGLCAYSLVTVYQPTGKRAFVTVGFPGMMVAGSAMNAKGLALGGNEVTATADGSPRLDLKGVPGTVMGRRILEDCTTLADMEKWLRANRPAGMLSVVACDQTGGAVFEVTTKNICVRRATNGICVGTNHFLCPQLAVATKCGRFEALTAAQRIPRLTVADVALKMHEANQGAATVHSMVFEPCTRRLHLAFGTGAVSATTRPLQTLDLEPLFRQ